MRIDGACHCAQAFCPDCGTRLYASAEREPQVFLPWVMDLGAVEQYAKKPA